MSLHDGFMHLQSFSVCRTTLAKNCCSIARVRKRESSPVGVKDAAISITIITFTAVWQSTWTAMFGGPRIPPQDTVLWGVNRKAAGWDCFFINSDGLLLWWWTSVLGGVKKERGVEKLCVLHLSMPTTLVGSWFQVPWLSSSSASSSSWLLSLCDGYKKVLIFGLSTLHCYTNGAAYFTTRSS